MKKRIFKGLAITAFAMVAGYNVYQSNNEVKGMSELMLANVEALAQGEQGTNCTGFYYVCQSNLASFLELKKSEIVMLII